MSFPPPWVAEILFVLWVSSVPLAAILVLVLPRSHVSRTALVALMGLIAFQVGIQTITYVKVTGRGPDFPFVYRLTFPLKTGSAILAYVFFSTLSDHNRGWASFSRVHFVPLVFALLYYVVFWILPVSPDFFTDSDLIYADRYVRQVISVVVSVVYLWMVIHNLRKADRDQRQTRSDLQTLMGRWSRSVLAFAFVAIGLSVVDILTGPMIRVWALDSSCNLFAFATLIAMALRTSALYDDLPAETAPLGPAKLIELSDRLKTHLKGQRLYVKQGLRLADLAEAMGVRPYIVSQVIRQGYQTTFYDLVNDLRVDEAKRLLMEAQSGKVLGIAFDCGFSTKSTFNDVFRKRTGMTPSEYRRSVLAN